MKFKCDAHQGPWYTIFVLEQREVEPKPRVEVRAVKRKRKTVVRFKDVGEEELNSEGEFQAQSLRKLVSDNSTGDESPYTPTHKSTKHRKSMRFPVVI